MIYQDSLAEILKEDAGKKWRPGNGTEGDMFFSAMCENCQSHELCPIIPMTMAYDVEDEEYPEEWIIGQDGQPTCTAFLADNLDS